MALVQQLPLAQLSQVLETARAKFPAAPQVEGIEVRDYENWLGDDALEVYVILADNVRDEDQTWAKVEPIASTIRSSISAAGESRFAYVAFGTRQDFAQRNNYDPTTDQ